MNITATRSPLAQQRVGDLVRERPLRGRVFDSLGIDYCCGGNQTLAGACAAADVPLVTAVGLLGQSDDESLGVAAADWSTAYLSALIDHIVEKHHAYLRRELPRLASSLQRVRRAHVDRHPELCEIAQIFTKLADELSTHMLKEEQVLFPLVKRLEEVPVGGRARQMHPPLEIDQPIGRMEEEHRSAGAALRRIRWLMNDFRPPRDACNAYHTLLAGLEALEADLHSHIHKENNILFPRAQQLWDSQFHRYGRS
jgi:regulator of cell morphogenesis and NO signaling